MSAEMTDTSKMTEEEYARWEADWSPLTQTNSAPMYRRLRELKTQIMEYAQAGRITPAQAFELGCMIGEWDNVVGQLFRVGAEGEHPFVGDVAFHKGIRLIEMTFATALRGGANQMLRQLRGRK